MKGTGRSKKKKEKKAAEATGRYTYTQTHAAEDIPPYTCMCVCRLTAFCTRSQVCSSFDTPTLLSSPFTRFWTATWKYCFLFAVTSGMVVVVVVTNPQPHSHTSTHAAYQWEQRTYVFPRWKESCRRFTTFARHLPGYYRLQPDVGQVNIYRSIFKFLCKRQWTTGLNSLCYQENPVFFTGSTSQTFCPLTSEKTCGNAMCDVNANGKRKANVPKTNALKINVNSIERKNKQFFFEFSSSFKRLMFYCCCWLSTHDWTEWIALAVCGKFTTAKATKKKKQNGRRALWKMIQQRSLKKCLGSQFLEKGTNAFHCIFTLFVLFGQPGGLFDGALTNSRMHFHAGYTFDTWAFGPEK